MSAEIKRVLNPDGGEVPDALGEEKRQEIKQFIANIAGVDLSIVTDEAIITKDLDVDSISLVELLMALEDEFGVSIPDEDAERFYRVRHAIDYINVLQTKDPALLEAWREKRGAEIEAYNKQKQSA